MEINFLALFVAALSTLAVGFIWYHPKVFGTIWMREAGVSPEQPSGGTMAKVFIMTIVYAFFIAWTLQFLVIHQIGAVQATGGDILNAEPSFKAFMTDYGTTFRTFKHGLLHGFFAGLFFALPVLGTSSLYENKGWKYVLVNGGFWIVCCMLMGGIICAWV